MLQRGSARQTWGSFSTAVQADGQRYDGAYLCNPRHAASSRSAMRCALAYHSGPRSSRIRHPGSNRALADVLSARPGLPSALGAVDAAPPHRLQERRKYKKIQNQQQKRKTQKVIAVAARGGALSGLAE
ncbi:hypothetical protein HA50_18115 [Pantoea cypripedii]|uniref:Uncharacterized protein n=1 Tax=Pantoea cypripedii TaxID=55209 RepID=A0A1X1EZ37_PANCY|nr:hypothetical protein HA50_18115 [Pantoea cypripedii]